MQTPRINTHGVTAAWAAQTLSVAISLGAAAHECGAVHDIDLVNPAARDALDSAVLVLEGASLPSDAEPFLMTSTSRLLPHALPTRLCSHSFLDTVKELAITELERGLLSQYVPQRSDALANLCLNVANDLVGVNIWSSWVLVCFMLGEPRLRRLLRASPITDFEVIVARVFQNYGRSEITRRARMDVDAKPRAAAVPSSASTSSTDPSSAAAGPASASGASSAADPLRPPDDDIQIAAPDAAEVKTAQTLMSMMTSIAESDQAIMAAKKKRVAAGTLGSGSDPSAQFLSYWDAAVRSSRYMYILKSLITQSRHAALTAAVESVSSQTSKLPSGREICDNPLLMTVSTENAVRSAKAVSSLIVATREHTPRIVAWRSRCDDYASMRTHMSVLRSPEDAAHTSIHACTIAPVVVQPQGGLQNHTVAVWSHAVRNVTPINAATTIIPGVMEGHAHAAAVHADQGRSTGLTRLRVDALLQQIDDRVKRLARDGDVSTTLSGIARGILVLRTKMVVSHSQVAAGKAIAADVAKLASTVTNGRGAKYGIAHQESVHILDDSELSRLAEPYVTPCSPLGIGMEVNETQRTLMRNRSHRGDPCRHVCGVATLNELNEASADELDKPATLLTLIDVKVDFLERFGAGCPPPNASPDADAPIAPMPAPMPAPCLPNRRDASLRTAALTLTVGGDAPVRLPELLRLFTVARRDVDRATAFQMQLEARALLLGGVARASEMNELSLATTAGAVNASIASAKRLTLNDYNLHVIATPFQVYRVGHANLPEIFSATPWAGCYGAGFELGTSGGIGIRASALTADKRHHGKLLMNQDQVDAFCDALARVHYMQVDAKRYAAIPREARGVPHHTVPGLHAYLDNHYDGLERARDLLGLTDRRTRDSLQCLPFSPYSERLSPDSTEDHNADFRFRNPEDSADADGRAFLCDATCEDLSIFREPFFKRASMCSQHDNVFASSKPFVSSFFLSANALALLARESFTGARPCLPATTSSPREEIAYLKAMLDAFHTAARGAGDALRIDFLSAADASLLLNSMFPCSVAIDGQTICGAYAAAPAQEAELIRFQLASSSSAPANGAPLAFLGLSEHEVRKAREFWAPFARADYSVNPWTFIAPLLQRILEQNGSFDLSRQELDATANDLQMAVRASFFLHSKDGRAPPVAPSPLAGLRSHTRIRNNHLDPKFAGGVDHNGVQYEARGALVGLPAMGLQQLVHLLMGAATNKTVLVGYALNFGQLCFRPSSAADILSGKGEERNPKAVSALSVDGDELACGTRAEKLKLCALQRHAFAVNLEYVKALLVNICTPKPESERVRGDARAVEFIQARRAEYDARGVTSKEEQEAAGLFAAASSFRS